MIESLPKFPEKKSFIWLKYSVFISESAICCCLLIFCCKVQEVQNCKQLAGKGHVVTKNKNN